MKDNQQRARHFLELACLANDEGNLQKEIRYLKKSAALGSNEAKVNLGHLYSEGRGVELSPSLAKGLYRSAFKGGCVYGATALGIQYKNEGKLRLAALWLTKAANMGEDWAQDALADVSVSEASKNRLR